MAEKDQAPQFNPKHRIVGAIVVVALAVLLVPMILDENEPPAEIKSVTELPPPKSPGEAGDTRVVVTPVAELAEPVKAPAKPEPSILAATPAPTPPAAVEQAAPLAATEPVSDKAPEKAATAAAKPAKTAKTVSEPKKIDKGWVIQIGVYKERANAERLRERLGAQGHKVKAEQVTLDGAKATRLRMGPYSDRATALKIQARIEKESGLKVAVYHYP
jgi:DedD protein